jgi:hypothetical protein
MAQVTAIAPNFMKQARERDKRHMKTTNTQNPHPMHGLRGVHVPALIRDQAPDMKQARQLDQTHGKNTYVFPTLRQ